MEDKDIQELFERNLLKAKEYLDKKRQDLENLQEEVDESLFEYNYALRALENYLSNKTDSIPDMAKYKPK